MGLAKDGFGWNFIENPKTALMSSSVIQACLGLGDSRSEGYTQDQIGLYCFDHIIVEELENDISWRVK